MEKPSHSLRLCDLERQLAQQEERLKTLERHMKIILHYGPIRIVKEDVGENQLKAQDANVNLKGGLPE